MTGPRHEGEYVRSDGVVVRVRQVGDNDFIQIWFEGRRGNAATLSPQEWASLAPCEASSPRKFDD